ncbi:hypothetical protein M9458_043541, partial [Cirrhinus mrigala]
EMRHKAKKEVAKAKEKAYDKLYEKLNPEEGEKELDRAGKDVLQVRVIKDAVKNVLTSEEIVLRRWMEYFEELMNVETERERRLCDVEMKRMKSGKVVGPDEIPVEAWRCLGEMAVKFLTRLFDEILESESMPEEWRRSALVPIYKNKGDAQGQVMICEQQYGFMPGKSTTDAVFALRVLLE